MKCKELETHGIAYLDGRLARREAEAVESHLAGCAACAERLHQFSGVSSLLDGWEPMQPSASFNARLAQRIRTQETLPNGLWERMTLWLRVHPFRKPAVAGALLGIMLFAVILTKYEPGTSVAITQDSANTTMVATRSDGSDDLALYQDLPVLENLDLLSNFEVLQDLQTMSQ
jgi:anti-sigma factor RsiW